MSEAAETRNAVGTPGDEQTISHAREGDENSRRHEDTAQLVRCLLDSPHTMRALSYALTPMAGQSSEREAGENGNMASGGEDPTRMHVYQAPGNAADFRAFAHTGRPTPNAGYFGTQAGLFTPNTGFMYPHMGHPIPYLPMPPLMPGPGSCPMLPQGRLEVDLPQTPGTSSSVAPTSVHEDAISPFLSHTEGRKFRDSEDSESDSDEETETASNKGKFVLSENAAKQLAEVMENL